MQTDTMEVSHFTARFVKLPPLFWLHPQEGLIGKSQVVIRKCWRNSRLKTFQSDWGAIVLNPFLAVCWCSSENN